MSPYTGSTARVWKSAVPVLTDVIATGGCQLFPASVERAK
jgi:hypothetical protein